MAAVWLAAGGKLGFGVKPPTPVLNLGHPLAQGLVFDAQYFAPGLGGNIERTGRTPRSTYTATTTAIGPHGVARTFPGASATDRDVYLAHPTVNGLNATTIELLIRPTTASVNSSGNVFYKGNTSAGAERFQIIWDDTNQSLLFISGWGTAEGVWDTPASSVLSGAWHHVVIAYSFGATTNDPTIYINGVPVSLTEYQAPVGTATTDATSLIIGNKGTNDNPFGGNVSHARMWNRLLTGAEVAALYSDPFQVYARPRRLAAAVVAGVEHLASATFSASGALVGQARLAASVAATFAGTGSLAAAARNQRFAAASLAASGSLSALARRDLAAASGLAATGDLTGAALRIRLAAAALSGIGSMLSTGRRALLATTILSGTGALSAAAGRQLAGATALSANGTLLVMASAPKFAAAVLSAAGAMTAAATTGASQGAAANLSGVSALEAQAARALHAAATLLAAGLLSATGRRDTEAAAVLSASGAMVAIATLISPTAGASATFSATGTMTGQASVTRGTGANLTGMGSVTSAVTINRQARAGLAAAGDMQARGRAARRAGAVLSGSSLLIAAVTDTNRRRATRGRGFTRSADVRINTQEAVRHGSHADYPARRSPDQPVRGQGAPPRRHHQ